MVLKLECLTDPGGGLAHREAEHVNAFVDSVIGCHMSNAASLCKQQPGRYLLHPKQHWSAFAM